MKFLKCTFSYKMSINEKSVRMDNIEISKYRNLRYLGLNIQNNGGLVEEITYRIRARWVKWRRAS